MGKAAGAAGWSGGEPEDVAAWTLVRAHHLVSRVFQATLAPHGISPQQFGVLIELERHPQQSQAALARAVLATPQAVGELVRGMESHGLVRRSAPDRPGLPYRLEATDHGRSVLDECTVAVLESVAPPRLGLEPAEAVELNRLLHRLITALST